MKNIGILTFAAADNYGGLLQCYSLYSNLKKSSCDVEVINYAPSYITNKYEPYTSFFGTYKQYRKRKLKLPFVRACKTYMRNIYLVRNCLKREKFNAFRKRNLTFSEKCTDYISFKRLSGKYDAIFVGSDQIWNKRITGGAYDKVFFLEGLGDGVIKIAYSASAGDTIPQQDITDIKKLLKNFDFISTREAVLAEQINKMNLIRCYDVLDPVFLRSKEDWRKDFCRESNLSDEKYILVYNVSSKDTTGYYKAVNYMAAETGYKVYEIAKKRKLKCNGKLLYNVGPDKFVELISNAEYVITTSFHATAMSIILEKQFWVFCPNEASRIENLLEKMGIKDRMLYDGDRIRYKDAIDYQQVNRLKKPLEEESKRALTDALSLIKQ